MLLQSVRATLPNVVFSVSPHEHTKCAGKSFDFSTPTCLPAEQGEAPARCQEGAGSSMLPAANTKALQAFVSPKQAVKGCRCMDTFVLLLSYVCCSSSLPPTMPLLPCMQASTTRALD
jgi:hypothetical protein